MEKLIRLLIMMLILGKIKTNCLSKTSKKHKLPSLRFNPKKNNNILVSNSKGISLDLKAA